MTENQTTPAPKAEKKAKTTEKSTSNFRVSQALYRTILTNLNVILVVFIAGLVGWLFWYLSPLTSSNTTYNADAHENALALVINQFADSRAMQGTTNTATTSAPPRTQCDLASPKSQQQFSDSISRINQSLTGLYQQKRLANHYQLQTTGLWEQACAQNLTDDAMRFAFKTLASPDKLMQLQWLEQRPNRKNLQDTSSVATMPTNWLTQTNPWYGLPGCVYIKTDKTVTNQTGYQYIDTRTNVNSSASSDDSLTQLCNHPKLIPIGVKEQTLIAEQQVVNQATKNSTVAGMQAQAEAILNDIKDRPTTDPTKLIPATTATNTPLPANLGTMYSELSNIHASHFDRQLLDAYQSYQQKNDQRNWWQKLTAPPMNTIALDGSDIKIGYNMALTIDPKVQATAQNVADCVTNSPNASINCDTLLSPQLQSIANQLYEKALVRSIGIAVLDVKTQGVLALASSDSNCYRRDNGDSTIKTTGCPTLWQKDWSKQNLMNHALYQTVYPGSIVKTVQALGLVRANPRLKNPSTPEYQYLKQVMASSSTEKVANFLFCQKTTSSIAFSRDGQGMCKGISAFKKASDDMGWSANCSSNDNKGSVNCGFKDLLFGKPYNSEPMLQSRYFSGVLLTDGKKDYAGNELNFTANQVASCVQGNGGRMNGACRRGGDQINSVMNQVFGAGNAKTSVLGASDMFATLLIADNGQKSRRGAHLVDDLWGVNQIPLRPKAWRGDAPYGQYDNLAMMPVNISQSDARTSLSLLSGTLLAGTGLGGGNGTAFKACNQAIGNCSWTKGVIVGKTGTPGFNYPTKSGGRVVYTPNVTTTMVANLCNSSDPNFKPSVTCYTRPYKWFVYGLKDKNGKWDKAVAVLVERNWQKNGLVDDPKDGINRAVQAGMILAKEIYQSDKAADNAAANSAMVSANEVKPKNKTRDLTVQ